MGPRHPRPHRLRRRERASVRQTYLHEGGWEDPLQQHHAQGWVMEEMSIFHQKHSKWDHRRYSVCCETWPTQMCLGGEPSLYTCVHCRRDKHVPCSKWYGSWGTPIMFTRAYSARRDAEPHHVCVQKTWWPAWLQGSCFEFATRYPRLHWSTQWSSCLTCPSYQWWQHSCRFQSPEGESSSCFTMAETKQPLLLRHDTITQHTDPDEITESLLMATPFNMIFVHTRPSTLSIEVVHRNWLASSSSTLSQVTVWISIFNSYINIE